MLYGWTFNFHKVVRQQNSGSVEDCILSYFAVYLRIQKWKNYWNRSTFAKVIVKIKVAPFLMAHGIWANLFKKGSHCMTVSFHKLVNESVPSCQTTWSYRLCISNEILQHLRAVLKNLHKMIFNHLFLVQSQSTAIWSMTWWGTSLKCCRPLLKKTLQWIFFMF